MCQPGGTERPFRNPWDFQIISSLFFTPGLASILVDISVVELGHLKSHFKLWISQNPNKSTTENLHKNEVEKSG